jgi:hypothetical protein
METTHCGSGDTGRFARQIPVGPRENQSPQPGAAEAGQESPQEDPFILCRGCLHPVTRPAERIEVQGGHQHTFANPHGIVFDIGCFREAEGCGYVGPSSDEFTWFAGCRWRVCVCAACLTHLGWLFTCSSGGAFHGLILDRLIEPS